MKTYIGMQGGRVSVEVDGESYPLDPRVDLLSYYSLIADDENPWFEWGLISDGQGRTTLDGQEQLALAILADHMGNDLLAIDHAAEFSRRLIALLPRYENFKICEEEVKRIIEWIARPKEDRRAP